MEYKEEEVIIEKEDNLEDFEVVDIQNGDEEIGLDLNPNDDSNSEYFLLEGIETLEELSLILKQCEKFLDREDCLPFAFKIGDKVKVKGFITPSIRMLNKLRYIDQRYKFSIHYSEDEVIDLDLTDSDTVLKLITL